MAIYKGREVQLLTTAPVGYIEHQNVTVTYKDGQTENVPMNQIAFSEDEKKQLQKDAGNKFEQVNVISDKDLKDLQDSQDPKKNEERMQANPVPDSQVMKVQEVDSANKPVVQASQK